MWVLSMVKRIRVVMAFRGSLGLGSASAPAPLSMALPLELGGISHDHIPKGRSWAIS